MINGSGVSRIIRQSYQIQSRNSLNAVLFSLSVPGTRSLWQNYINNPVASDFCFFLYRKLFFTPNDFSNSLLMDEQLCCAKSHRFAHTLFICEGANKFIWFVDSRQVTVTRVSYAPACTVYRSATIWWNSARSHSVSFAAHMLSYSLVRWVCPPPTLSVCWWWDEVSCLDVRLFYLGYPRATVALEENKFSLWHPLSMWQYHDGYLCTPIKNSKIGSWIVAWEHKTPICVYKPSKVDYWPGVLADCNQRLTVQVTLRSPLLEEVPARLSPGIGLWTPLKQLWYQVSLPSSLSQILLRL